MESLNDALITCVKDCGGSKAVGCALWPEKSTDSAQRLLLDCLNEDRPQRLAPEQVLLILRYARERGCHVGMQFLADELSYAAPVPIEPKDEADELRRQVLAMGRDLKTALLRLEALERPLVREVRP